MIRRYFYQKVSMFQSCRGVEVAGRTFDRQVEGSSPDRNIIGCRQEGHPGIKWLTAPVKSPEMQAPNVKKTTKVVQTSIP